MVPVDVHPWLSKAVLTTLTFSFSSSEVSTLAFHISALITYNKLD